MKNTLFALKVFILILFLISSCTKQNEDSHNSDPVNPNLQPTSIISGRWKVVNDSLANIGDYYNGGFPIPGNYIGNSSDFMDFKSNGEVNFKIYWYTGTCKYNLLSDSSISIQQFQPTMHKAKIINVTSTSLTLYGTDTSSNGGVLIKIINLKR